MGTKQLYITRCILDLTLYKLGDTQVISSSARLLLYTGSNQSPGYWLAFGCWACATLTFFVWWYLELRFQHRPSHLTSRIRLGRGRICELVKSCS